MPLTRRVLSILCLAAFIAVSSSSCNVFEKFKLESNKTDEDRLSEAQAEMDAGNCAKASQIIEEIKVRTSKVQRVYGWAQLCAGGAGLKKVLTTLVTFTSGSSSAGSNTVGTLANSLVPQSDLTIGFFTKAIQAFAAQDPGTDQTVNLMIAYLIKASAYISKQSRDGRKTYRTDIAPAACTGVTDCTLGSAPCTEVMSDADANAFIATISSAGTAVTAGLGSVGDLVKNLQGQLPASAAAAVGRCVIVNSLLRE